MALLISLACITSCAEGAIQFQDWGNAPGHWDKMGKALKARLNESACSRLEDRPGKPIDIKAFTRFAVELFGFRASFLFRYLDFEILRTRKKNRSAVQTRQLLEVRTSTVHGRGVFALKPIRRGTRIIEYTGRRIPWSSVAEDLDDELTYYFGLDNGKQVIDPTVGGNEAQWINHSCEPNCQAIENSDDRVFIYALRNIQPGEELFYDYRLEVDVPRTRDVEEENRCACGSSKCRGTMLNPN